MTIFRGLTREVDAIPSALLVAIVKIILKLDATVKALILS